MNTPASVLNSLEKELIINASDALDQNSYIKSRFPNPLNYICLRKLFGSEKNKDILMSFINAILEEAGSERAVEVEFLDFSYYKDELNRNFDKLSPVDVMCTDKEGNEFIVQIGSFETKQPAWQEACQEIKDYGYRTYIDDIASREEKYRSIKKIYFIALLSEQLVKEGEPLFDEGPIHKSCDPEEALQIICIEMPKYKKIFDKEDFRIQDIESNSLLWGYLLSYIPGSGFKESPQMDEICNARDKNLKKAYRSLEDWTIEELREYIKVEANEVSHQLRDEQIYQMGLEAKIARQEKIAKQEWNLWNIELNGPAGADISVYVDKSFGNGVILGEYPEKDFPENYIFLKRFKMPG